MSTSDLHSSTRSGPLRTAILGVLLGLATSGLYFGTLRLADRFETPNVAYFDHLAASFLRGRLDLPDPPGRSDLSPYKGREYVAFPPLPAILLMPWVAALGVSGVSTPVFSVVLATLSVLVVWRMLDRLAARGWIELSATGLLWVVAFFAAGCVHWQVACEGSVWFLGHVCTTLCLALAGWLAACTPRASPAGTFLALAVLGRPHVLLTWPLLLGCRLMHARSDSQPMSRAAILRWSAVSLLPSAVAALALLSYNAARFDHPLDFGYARQRVDASLLDDLHRVGQFSLDHVPRNLHLMLFGPPRWSPPPWYPLPDDRGMSVLLTSPALFLLALARRRDPLARGAWTSIGLVLIPLLLYYNTGWRQFGYRFSLDFMIPALVLLSTGLGPRAGWSMRIAVLAGILMNAWGVVWWYTDWLEAPPNALQDAIPG